MKQLIALAVLLAGLSLTAQNTPTYTEGSAIETDKKTPFPRRIVYADANGCLVVGNSDGDLGVQHLNADLKPSTPVVIDNWNKTNDVLRNSGYIVINKMLCTFWILEEAKADKFTLYYQMVDLQTGKELTEKTVLITANTFSDAEVAMYRFQSNYYDFFRIAVAPDHSKFVVVFPEAAGDKTKESYSVEVFDSLMHPLRNTKQTFSFEHGYYFLKDLMITNDGDVVFSGIETKDEHKTNTYPNYFPYVRPVGVFHITLWSAGSGFPIDNTVKIDGKLVTDVAFRYDGKSIQVMGFWSPTVSYSNKIKFEINRWYATGSFFMELDVDDLTPTVPTLNTFEQKLIDDCNVWVAQNKTDVDRRKIEVYCLTAEEVVKMPSGDFVLLSEHLSEYAETQVYSANIVVCRYGSDGKHKVTVNVPRLEVLGATPSLRFSREYISYTDGDNICFIYSKVFQGVAYKIATKNNDAVRQEEIPETSIVHAVVAPNGDVKKTVLKDREGNLIFQILHSTAYTDQTNGRIYFAAVDGRDIRYAKVNYK